MSLICYTHLWDCRSVQEYVSITDARFLIGYFNQCKKAQMEVSCWKETNTATAVSQNCLCSHCLAYENCWDWVPYFSFLFQNQLSYSDTWNAQGQFQNFIAERKRTKQVYDFTVSSIMHHFFLQEQPRQIKKNACLLSEVSNKKSWNSTYHMHWTAHDQTPDAEVIIPFLQKAIVLMNKAVKFPLEYFISDFFIPL